MAGSCGQLWALMGAAARRRRLARQAQPQHAPHPALAPTHPAACCVPVAPNHPQRTNRAKYEECLQALNIRPLKVEVGSRSG